MSMMDKFEFEIFLNLPIIMHIIVLNIQNFKTLLKTYFNYFAFHTG